MKIKKILIPKSLQKKLGDDFDYYRDVLRAFKKNPLGHGYHFEKLEGELGKQELSSIRVGRKPRIVLCKISSDEDGAVMVATRRILENHEYNRVVPLSPEELEALAQGNEDDFISIDLLEDEIKDEADDGVEVSDRIEFINNQVIVLDEEQFKTSELGRSALPLIISGAPGSGKSSVLLSILRKNIEAWSNRSEDEPLPKLLILAKSPKLIEKMQQEWHAIYHNEFQGKENILPRDCVEFKTPEMIYQHNNPGVACVGEQEFIGWYGRLVDTKNRLAKNQASQTQGKKRNNKAAQQTKDRPMVEVDQAHLMYQEFLTMSGYKDFEAYNEAVSKQFSLFPDPAIRESLWGVFEEYQTTLRKHQQIDVAFQPIVLPSAYRFIGVDETQDLSRIQIRSLVQNQPTSNANENAPQHNLVFNVGDHQRLFGSETTVPFIRSMFWEKYGTHDVAHKILTASYRCAERVIAVANAVLQLKYKAIGGTAHLDKNELVFVRPCVVDRDHGDIHWIENEAPLNTLIEKHRNDAQFVVITSIEFLEEARRLFGYEKVFTAEQFKGLEAANVLLYRPLQQTGFKEANTAIGADFVLKNPPPNTIEKSQSNEASIRHSSRFNQLFVAVTRAQQSLTIYQPYTKEARLISTPLKRFMNEQKNPSPAKQQEAVISTVEEWRERARQYRSMGYNEQAEVIEKQWLQPKAAPQAHVETTNATQQQKRSRSSVNKKMNQPSDIELLELLLQNPEAVLPKIIEHEDSKRLLFHTPLNSVNSASVAEYMARADAKAFREKFFQGLARLVEGFPKPNSPRKNDILAGLLHYQPNDKPTKPLAFGVLERISINSTGWHFMKNYREIRIKKLKTQILQGDSEAIESLVKLDAINYQDQKKSTILHCLAAEIRPKHALIDKLIQAGANVDIPDENGNTALHSAALCGHTELLQSLTKHSKKPNATNKNNKTAEQVLASQIAAAKKLINQKIQPPPKIKPKELPLTDIQPVPSLEKYDYHTYTFARLTAIQDAESLFERGHRLANGFGVDRDVDRGWKLMLEAARLGHPVALALCFTAGIETTRDDARAVGLLEPSAQRGHVVAQFNLGVCHYQGVGVKKIDKQAAEYFQQAANSDFAPALFNLGNCYGNGIGVKLDYAKAAYYHKRAASKGRQDAIIALPIALGRLANESTQPKYLRCVIRNVAWIGPLDLVGDGASDADGKVVAYERLMRGIGVDRDETTAKRYLFEAALQRQPIAIAACIIHAIEFERNEKNLGFAVKLLQAFPDNPEAQFYLAHCHDQGLGVPADPKKSIELLRESAAKGNAAASRLYAEALERSAGIEKAPAADKALQQQKKVDLIDITPKPELEKNDYHTLPFEQLETIDDSESLLERGHRLANGYGVNKNVNAGWEFIGEAARQGHPVALALCFAAGQGTKRDDKSAVELYEQSASRGHYIALFDLGGCYIQKIGVNRDFPKAFALFKQAAECHFAAAEFNTGNCYGGNVGVERNYALAAYYFKRAADAGRVDSQELLSIALDRLTKQLNPENLTCNTRSIAWIGDLDLTDASGMVVAYVRLSRGIGVSRDETAARRCLFYAALCRHPIAIAMCIIDGIEFERNEQNLRLAISLLKKFSDNPEAKRYLAQCYARGMAATPDGVSPTGLLQESADAGNLAASFLYAEALERGVGVEQSLEKAVAKYTESAKQGSSDALYKMSGFYRDGNECVRSNFKQYIQCLQQAARLNHPEAREELGQIDLPHILSRFKDSEALGHDALSSAAPLGEENFALAATVVQVDMTKLVQSLETAFANAPENSVVDAAPITDPEPQQEQADLTTIIPRPELEKPDYHAHTFEQLQSIDDSESLFLRGYRLMRGFGVHKDEKQGWSLIREAALQGHPVALGLCLQTGHTTPQNTERAIEYYRGSALRGHLMAQTRLGGIYYTGKDVAQSIHEAARYHRLAADRNYPLAESLLGDCYANGQWELRDYAQAAHYYKRALEHGHIQARPGLGSALSILATELKPEHLRCDTRPISWTGDLDVSDAYAKVVAYQRLRDGIGVKRDEAAAKRILFEAALERQPIAIAVCIIEGIEFERNQKNFRLAVLLLLAFADDPIAKFRLSLCYAQGFLVPRQKEKAMELLKESSEAGNLIASCLYARELELGPESSRDLKQAVEKYQESATQGCSDALYQMSTFYRFGNEFVQASPEKYLESLQQAARLNHPLAIQELSLIDLPEILRNIANNTSTPAVIPRALNTQNPGNNRFGLFNREEEEQGLGQTQRQEQIPGFVSPQ